VSAKQSGPKTGWLQNLGTDTGTCEHHATTSPWHQQLEAAPHWHMIKQIIKRTKTISFQSQHTTPSALFRATNSLRRKYVVSCHFGRSYLKANKVSKSEGIRKFEYACHFWKCADAVFEKPEFVHACQNYSLPKLAFFWHTVYISFASQQYERIPMKSTRVNHYRYCDYWLAVILWLGMAETEWKYTSGKQPSARRITLIVAVSILNYSIVTGVILCVSSTASWYWLCVCDTMLYAVVAQYYIARRLSIESAFGPVFKLLVYCRYYFTESTFASCFCSLSITNCAIVF